MTIHLRLLIPLLFLVVWLPSAGTAQTPIAAPTAALLPATGAYDYHVIVRGMRDAAGHVDVSGSTIVSKTTLQFMSTYLIAGSVTPHFTYSQTYYSSTLRLDADVQPASLTLEIRPDAGLRTYVLATRQPQGIVVSGLGSHTLTYTGASDRWVNVDGLNFAGAFALPAGVLAAEAHALTVFSASRSSSGAYACTNDAMDRPKDVPAADAVFRCSGDKEEATVWYDPGTLVPDKIELPRERTTLIRISNEAK